MTWENKYNKISSEYIKTHEKPDKKYSMVPTAVKLAGPLKNKTVVDVGCGAGLFTFLLAKKAKLVYGIDSSSEQIRKAKNRPTTNVKFILADMLKFNYPKADVINAPFVLGYIKSSKQLKNLFSKLHQSLKRDGKIIGIIDAPKSTFHDNKKFGAVKKVKGGLKEGAKIIIELYNNKTKLVTLRAYYHTKKTIEDLLKNSGFKFIKWHRPVVSKEGMAKKGKKYWKEYLNNLDTAYFTAQKS